MAETGAAIKVFVDTAPVMEKPLAQAAGLGWQGKHTNLLSRDLGNWFFLGAIFTELELPRDMAEVDHCGSCRACLDVCPTQAFPAPYQLDARRCISYLTIEHDGPIDVGAAPGARQSRSTAATIAWRSARGTSSRSRRTRRRISRGSNCNAPSWSIWRGWTTPRSARCSRGSPIKRIGRNRFMRNVAYAIGNSGDAGLIPAAERLAGDADPVVREAADWALRRLARA